MENNELSIKITASMNKALESINKFIPKVKETDNVVTKMLAHMDKNGQLTGFTAELRGLDAQLQDVSKSGKDLKSALNFSALVIGIKKIANNFNKLIQQSTNYSEALNLFNVVLDETNSKATRFQNIMNESFGTNQTDTLTRQGLYQSMAENMGISADYAYIMSENTTKLVNDISSLYNKNEDTVAEALRAGIYAGQTKPLRSFGMDITEKTLQPELDRLGIDRTVRDLNQAEKQLLRYISVLRQSSEAQGDWANTIEAPANQLKIFNNQVEEMKKSIGNLFVGAFAKILPIANAVVMVIEEVANAIATLFGIEISDYNTGIADMSDAFVDLEDDIDDATGSAKELKRQLLKFDQVNNINDNKNSGSGISSVSGGIDQRLLDAITGYDNGMESVRMKAVQIRDNIMKWLGFTKEIDPLTGDVSFKYQGIDITLKNMWKSFKNLSKEGKMLVGLGLVAGATSLWGIGKKLVGVFGNSGLGKVLKSLISPSKSLLNWVKLGVKTNKNLVNGIEDGIVAWREQNILVKDAEGNLKKFQTATNGAKNVLNGLVLASGGLLILDNSMESVVEEGANLANILGTIGGTLGLIAGGAQIGSVFGPIGTSIGVATTAIVAFVDILSNLPEKSYEVTKSLEEQTNKLSSYLQEYESFMESTRQSIQEELNSKLTTTGVYSELLEELEHLVEANGRVKTGYEDRVSYILNELSDAYGVEVELINGVILDYDDYIQKIKETIKAKEAEYILEANRDMYVSAKGKELQLYTEMYKAQKEQNKAKEEYKRLEQKLIDLKNDDSNYYYRQGQKEEGKAIKETRKELEALTKKIQENQEKLNDATVDYKENKLIQMRYSDISTAVITGDYKKINEAIENYSNSYIDNGELVKATSAENLSKIKYDLDILEIAYEENGDAIVKAQLDAQKKRYDALVESLFNETKAVEEITDEQATAWGDLATADKDKFLEVFAKLPDDIQTQIVDKMQDKGYSISEELQKGINELKPQIKITANTKSAETKLETFFTTIKNKITSLGGGTLSFGSGGGGSRAIGGVYANGKWHNVTKYASGGLPSMGELFVAREAGPELVGKIGSHTAVMNNNQIVESVKAGVYEAVSMAMANMGSSNVNVNVKADKGFIVETAVNGIQQHVNTTGELPFTAPI